MENRPRASSRTSKVVRTEPVPNTPNVIKVYYADGGVGFQGIDRGNGQSMDAIPDQGRSGQLIAWNDSMDKAASPQEIDEIRSKISSVGMASPSENMEALMRRLYANDPEYRNFTNDINTFDANESGNGQSPFQNPEQHDAAWKELQEKHGKFIKPIGESKSAVSGYLENPEGYDRDGSQRDSDNEKLLEAYSKTVLELPQKRK